MSTILQRQPLVGDAALLVLRVVVGGVILAHGLQKFLAFGIAGTTASFEEMGIPLAAIVAPTIATLEVVSGLALIVGILPGVFGLLVVADMLVALVSVHLPFGVFVTDGGIELVAVLGSAALALAVFGAGRWSLAAVIGVGRGSAAERSPVSVAD